MVENKNNNNSITPTFPHEHKSELFARWRRFVLCFFSKKLINQSRVGFADFGSHQNASLWRNINVHKPLTHPPRAAVFILLVSLFILFLLRTFIIIQKSFSFYFLLFFWCSAGVKRREMPQDTTSEQDPDDSDAEFVEIDPSARYGRVSFFFFFLIFMKFIIFMRKIIGIF